MVERRLGRILLTGSLWVLLACLFCAPRAHAAVYWELNPVKDKQVSLGTYTVVGGKTASDGVRFTLKNNKATMPVVLTLVATTADTKLHLTAFKDAGPFLSSDTDADGRLVVRFRTGDDMNFNVSGPEGSTYQLSVWRGPEIVLAQSDAIVSMASVTGNGAADAGGKQGASSNGLPVAGAPAVAGSSNTLIYVLLAGILVALVVIAFLIFRGQQLRRGPQ
jgi:hypothetical protein